MSNAKDNLRHCGILIVEDDYLGRMVLREIFKKQGFTRIEEAENGKEALEKIHLFRPDLVILDVIMPQMDGVECCKRIRQSTDPQIANVPILFQTALDGIAEKVRLFEAGATDYLSKPIDPHEITARAIVHLEREVLTQRLREFNSRIALELDTARHAQQVLIPDDKASQEIAQDYRLRICGHYQPCSELGGDFWGFKSLSSEELAVYMVDFSGHGVNAALNVFRLHALMQAAMDTARVPGAYLSHLNAILAPMLPTGQFATMFYGIINNKRNTLSYASAAAPPPMLFSGQAAAPLLLGSTGTLLGAFRDASYEMAEVPFMPGDCLLLYSDALTETPDAHGAMAPIENWVDFLQPRLKAERDSCLESFAALLTDFQQRYAPHLTDDLTLSAYFRNIG